MDEILNWTVFPKLRVGWCLVFSKFLLPVWYIYHIIFEWWENIGKSFIDEGMVGHGGDIAGLTKGSCRLHGNLNKKRNSREQKKKLEAAVLSS